MDLPTYMLHLHAPMACAYCATMAHAYYLNKFACTHGMCELCNHGTRVLSEQIWFVCHSGLAAIYGSQTISLQPPAILGCRQSNLWFQNVFVWVQGLLVWVQEPGVWVQKRLFGFRSFSLGMKNLLFGFRKFCLGSRASCLGSETSCGGSETSCLGSETSVWVQRLPG